MIYLKFCKKNSTKLFQLKSKQNKVNEFLIKFEKNKIRKIGIIANWNKNSSGVLFVNFEL